MGKSIVAINASPRVKWNTAQLVRAAASGAEDAGAQAEVIDLYQLDPFMGCRSCFACMTEKRFGRCAIKDGLTETLDKIAEADGLILGTPNYFSRPTAGFRALYERLLFQHLTYDVAKFSSNERSIPVLFIMTSNAPDDMYAGLVETYKQTLSRFVGPAKTFVCGNTLQLKDYSKTDWEWTMFNPEEKQRRHEEVFPQERLAVRELGATLLDE